MAAIREVRAREVLDSRGWPTVEVEVLTDSGATGRAIVPSGASTGRAEALELRDGDPARFAGRGVRQAVGHVMGPLADAVRGLDVRDQLAIDRRLLDEDPTPRKTRLGANAVLGVSLAAAQAGAAAAGRALYEHLAATAQAEAQAAGQPQHAPPAPRLPLPMVNMISGGLHAGGQLDFQDFLVMPHAAPSYGVALEWLVAIYQALSRVLRAEGHEAVLVGDEGGYGPRLADARQVAWLVVRAIDEAGLVPGQQVSLALDVASSHFYREGRYYLRESGPLGIEASAMIDVVERLADEFPVVSVEDALSEEDWPGWRELTVRLGRRLWLVGDDLFATQSARVAQGIAQQAGNSVLIKFNQVGTLSETLATVRLARAAGYSFVVSARSGETEDTTLADLAVALAAPSIKIGSVARSERLAKYNQLWRIAERLPPREGSWHGWHRRG